MFTKCGKIMPLYSQARGDLEIQIILGIILKTKLVSSVSNKGLFNFQRVVITTQHHFQSIFMNGFVS